MVLFFSEHFREFMEMSYTSATKKVQNPVITVTWLRNVHNVISLWPIDTPSIIKLSDKHNVGVNTLQQLSTVVNQYLYPSLVQRTDITMLKSDFCRSNYTIITHCLESLHHLLLSMSLCQPNSAVKFPVEIHS